MWKQEYMKWIESSGIDTMTKTQLEAMDTDDIRESFSEKLMFGTGGVRGLMGIGSSKLNIHTIRKISLGFARYLKSLKIKNIIIIAYDTRKNSKQFAEEAAKVLLAFGFKVLIFDQPTPTPELSFSVRRYQADAGIVITASHNPSAYNGFKVYDNNGAQAAPVIMEGIEKFVEESIDYLEFNVENLKDEKFRDNIEIIDSKIDDEYITKVLKMGYITPDKNQERIKILYSPLHGTGIKLIPRMLTMQGFSDIDVVLEQSTQNGEFETLESPNPEDLSAYEILLTHAKDKKYNLLLATDPDADRIGVVCLHNGSYVYLSGNEVGILLLDYILTNKRDKTLNNNQTVLTTIVTTAMIHKMANDYGVASKSFLTGFKYIGEYIGKLNQEEFLFGLEESCGYLINPFVRDKDSIQAAAMIAEMTYSYKCNHISLVERLNELYEKYGYHENIQINFDLDGMSEEYTDAIILKFSEIENYVFPSSVVSTENYNTGKRYFKGGIVENINLPKENVLKIHFEDSAWIAVRSSGTESKMKIYIECVGLSEVTAKVKLEKYRIVVMTILDGNRALGR